MEILFEYCCAICHSILLSSKVCCGYQYIIEKNKIMYEHEKMLLNYFPKDFFLNKSLNTNGHLSYYVLPEGSISLCEREDVKAFAQYIKNFYLQGNILDVGCGPMEIPGYLDLIQLDKNKFFGLDPIQNIPFLGEKIIGSIEFLPCQDESFDTLIFATTLDHVCNLTKTFKEIYRVLKPNGKVIFWHWSNETPIKNWINRLKIKINIKSRYYSYPNNISFMIPSGAIDPFHKDYISLKKIFKLAKKNNFKLEDLSSNTNNKSIPQTHYFFVFKK